MWHRCLLFRSAVGVLLDRRSFQRGAEHRTLNVAGTERHSRVVRAFVDFLAEIFGDLDARRLPKPAAGVPVTQRPDWRSRARERHSAYAARRPRA